MNQQLLKVILALVDEEGLDQVHEVVAVTDETVHENLRVVVERHALIEASLVCLCAANPEVMARRVFDDAVAVSDDEHVPGELERASQCFLAVLCSQDGVMWLPSDSEPEVFCERFVQVLERHQNGGADGGHPETGEVLDGEVIIRFELFRVRNDL